MVKVRVIPTLLMKNFGLVKGVGFNSWRRVGSILPAIKVYTLRQVDELIIVDITATEERRDPDYQEIRAFSSECFVPLTIGGGIKNIDQVKQILRSGADKVCLNTSAVEEPTLINEIASKFGSQCAVVSIDAKKTSFGYECYTHSGTRATGRNPIDVAREAEQRGAGEILITSIDNDGTMNGYDIELIKKIVDSVTIPVISSGGAGNYEHMLQVINAGASAVAAASIFHFTHQTPLEAKKYLKAHGVHVRQ